MSRKSMGRYFDTLKVSDGPPALYALVPTNMRAYGDLLREAYAAQMARGAGDALPNPYPANPDTRTREGMEDFLRGMVWAAGARLAIEQIRGWYAAKARGGKMVLMRTTKRRVVSSQQSAPAGRD